MIWLIAAVGTRVQDALGGRKHLVNQPHVFHGRPVGIGQQFAQGTAFTSDFFSVGGGQGSLSVQVSDVIGYKHLHQFNGRALQDFFVKPLWNPL